MDVQNLKEELIVKETLQDLAIFGGLPAFSHYLHVGNPNIGNRNRLINRINNLLDRRRLTNRGPFVQEFEQKVIDLIGVRHCIAMTNGTVALEIAIRALGLSGEVIIPSMTFIATPHALQMARNHTCFLRHRTGNLHYRPRPHRIDDYS